MKLYAKLYYVGLGLTGLGIGLEAGFPAAITVVGVGLIIAAIVSFLDET